MSNQTWITVQHIPTGTTFLNDRYDENSVGDFEIDFKYFLSGIATSGKAYFESVVAWDDNLCRVIIPTEMAKELYVSTTVGGD